eukprot:1475305-Amphidinium_carterae.2
MQKLNVSLQAMQGAQARRKLHWHIPSLSLRGVKGARDLLATRQSSRGDARHAMFNMSRRSNSTLANFRWHRVLHIASRLQAGGAAEGPVICAGLAAGHFICKLMCGSVRCHVPAQFGGVRKALWAQSLRACVYVEKEMGYTNLVSSP